MIKPSISLQELRKRIYIQAKAQRAWRFWGLYVHVCKAETLREAYRLVKANHGAPGIDGVTFETIEAGGLEAFLQQLRDQLISGTYRPMRNRQKAIPKGDGRVRILGIPTIRDRVVQGALKLILEPIFEPDFQDGSYGYRPGRQAQQAVSRVAQAVVSCKTQVLDLDLKAYFDTVRHDLLLKKVAERVQDPQILHLLKMILQASGPRGVPQGGVISPLLANVYLNKVDKMLERAKAVTRKGRYTYVEYARYADDLVILIDGKPWHRWLVAAVQKRLLEELAKLDVQVNTEKTRWVDLEKRESFGFLGFMFRRTRTLWGRWGVRFVPKMKARTSLLERLKEIFRRYGSQPVARVIGLINPIVRGWVNYFRIGHSSHQLHYVCRWIEKKTRRHLMRARQRPGFGWKRWSKEWLYSTLGLYADYHVRYLPNLKAAPAAWTP